MSNDDYIAKTIFLTREASKKELAVEPHEEKKQ